MADLSLNALDYIPVGLHANIRNHTSADDVTVEIQAWLDDVKAQRAKGYLPAGLYKTSAPLWMTENATETSHIEGDGRGYTRSLAQSAIEASHTDGPILVIQHARGVRVSNILLRGPNLAPDTAAANPSDDSADWVTTGLRNTQWSPQCGVCVDPATGEVPPDGGYPGMTYQGGGGGSAQIQLENVSIEYCVIGYLQQPGVNGVQAEEIRLENCNIHHCDTGCSFAGGQNRANVIFGTGIWYCRTLITTAQNGNKAGAPPMVTSCHFLRAYRIFEYSVGQGHSHMSNVYSEQVKVLGTWGGNNAGLIFNMTMEGVYFSFQAFDDKLEPMLLEANSSFKMTGGAFFSSDKKAPSINIGGRAKLTFERVMFRGGWTDNDNAVIALNIRTGENQRVQLTDCSVFGDGTQELFIENEIVEPNRLTTIFVTNLIVNPGNVTFEVTGHTPGDEGNSLPCNPLKVGHQIFWRILPQGISIVPENTVPALKVTVVNGAAVTAEKLFNDAVYDLNYSPPLKALVLF